MERNGRQHSCVSVKKAINERAGPKARRTGSNAPWPRLEFTYISVGWVIAQIGPSAKKPFGATIISGPRPDNWDCFRVSEHGQPWIAPRTVEPRAHPTFSRVHQRFVTV